MILLKKLLIVFLISSIVYSCAANINTVDSRKKKLEQKKKRNPNDCPKLDC